MAKKEVKRSPRRPAAKTEQGIDAATMVQALAIQAEAGTPSAVEYLKAQDVDSAAIARLLSGEKPG